MAALWCGRDPAAATFGQPLYGFPGDQSSLPELASRLAMAGVGLRAIQVALGHKTIAMTVRYSHLSPEYLLDVVERLVPRPAAALSAEPTDTTTDTKPVQPIAEQAAYVH